MKKTLDKPTTKSVGKNYIYNVIYQVFVMVVPLITTPYISRVLSAEGVGQYSFSSSLCSYFTLVAALGFGYYAQRAIASKQDDKNAQSVVFWEIIIIRFFSVGLALGLNLILYFAGVYQTYGQLMLYWSLSIVAVEFDISFLFQGNEEFKTIVWRNILIRIVSIVLIFLLVKDSNDVYLYVICTAASTLLGNLSLWFYLPKYLNKITFNELHPTKHIAPTIRLFIPTIATSIYLVLDKTLIGLLITDTYEVTETVIVDGVEQVVTTVKKYSDLENGYYAQSEKIVKMCMTIMTSLGTVMAPRNSHLYAEGKQDGLKKNIYFATNYVWFLGVPMMLGLAAIAPNIIPWFLGSGYDKCVLLMQLFTPLIIFIGFSNIFGLQYLVPTQRDGKFTLGICAGAITNLVLNLILIPFFWSYGAVIATLVAEFTVTFIMYLMIRKEVSLKTILKQSFKPAIAGCVMFAAVYITQMFLEAKWYFSICLMLEGIAIYFILLLILKDKFLYHLLDVIKNKFLKKKSDLEI